MANTSPEALVVTEFQAEWQSARAFAVIAAGRAVVAVPELFSHPYLDWRERKAQRRRLIEALTRPDAAPVPCALARQGLWFVLDAQRQVLADRAEPGFRTPVHRIDRARPKACG